MRLSTAAGLLLALLPPATQAGKEAKPDGAETCAGQVVNENVIYNDLDAADWDPAHPPLLLSSIVSNGDDGACAIAAWGQGLVLTYYPNPGFVGDDRCEYRACKDADGDGAISAAEASGRCAEATLFITVNDCSTRMPTGDPTKGPTPAPSKDPTPAPSKDPTQDPTKGPTKSPTKSPTKGPTDAPTTVTPTYWPTYLPTKDPTPAPTKAPTKDPTKAPSKAPTKDPTKAPTTSPTDAPTTATPTSSPTDAPTKDPTPVPTKDPTDAPSKDPTYLPTKDPTPAPTNGPTKTPTDAPTKAPTENPTPAPTDAPTKKPTDAPTPDPTVAPTPDADPDPNGTGIAVDDAAATCAGVEVSQDVVANDVPPGTAPLLVSQILSGGDSGTCALAPGGSRKTVTYAPQPGFVGVDSCTYEACEDVDGDKAIGAGDAGGKCASATLTIAVAECPTDAPAGAPTTDQPTGSHVCYVIANDDAYTTPKNTQVLLTPLANDVLVQPDADAVPDPDLSDPFDPNPSDLAVVEVLFAGRRGTCAFYEALDDTTGEVVRSDVLLTYTPDEGFDGTDSCVYKTCDDDLQKPHCDIATITVTVLPSKGNPMANDDAVETPKGTPVAVYPLVNDEAVEGQPLVMTAIVDGGGGEHGACAVTADAVVTYFPDPGYAGLDECRYRACDDRGLCAEATIVITVVGENDEPCDKNPTPAPGGGETLGSPTISPTEPPTPSPTNGPTNNPTPSPTTPAPTRCEGRRFYYTASAGCSNEDNVAPGADIFETQEQCCIVKYPDPAEDCVVKDVCAVTGNPTPLPTPSPSGSPTTKGPTMSPSKSPTKKPTPFPTTSPTKKPTVSPSTSPITIVVDTPMPTPSPSVSPTKKPTISPSKGPTKKPTLTPTTPSPTKNPTGISLDTPAPSVKATMAPVSTYPPTWGGTPTVGKDTTAPPVNQREKNQGESRLRNMM